MARTSRRSLLTVLVALGLLIAQASLLASPFTTNAATVLTGPAIYLNPGSMVQASQNYVTVQGTGFTPGDTVVIAFNAPYSADGSPAANNLRATPPTVSTRPGDNRPCPPGEVTMALPSGADCGIGSPVAPTLGTPTITTIDETASPGAVPGGATPVLPVVAYPNIVYVLATATTTGNLIAAGLPQSSVQLPIPATAVDGTYEVTAYDVQEGTGTNAAATQFSIARQPTPTMTANPVSGPSAQIGGDVQVNLRQEAFQPYDVVQFFLEDFEASATFNPSQPELGTGAAFQSNLGLGSIPSEVGPPGAGGVATPCVPADGCFGGAVQLLVAQCGTLSLTDPNILDTSYQVLANDCPARCRGRLERRGPA